ncbi:multiple monosaccharide ABC transporter ATP-binding protein [Mobiluncus mulieris]|uniref:multiple monosaccharide ABC transporter ATP-binding protein n=1 Tax=Mobiluncus mulieris TaxID=2052 RepID=UPI00147045C3|nr:multiple monosaccharide ABC transporter ATP-binding protein [Mobiluncus mulieris]MCV0009366.1 sugar ABC transporter ATP-binding protein [Mobiluncus mulieris]NMW60919.1 sugar ABC transporter ATP-binding protein [Mobiluncus mulieris]
MPTNFRPVILEMRDIVKTFGAVKALKKVNFSVHRGEVHAICGENGAGKSTLMKVLSGVHPYGTYEGEIIYQSEPMKFSGIRDSEAKGIVIIHQELALCENLSILENIYLGRHIVKGGVIQWEEMRKETTRLLAKVGLDDQPDTLVGQLGVGKQQLVEIAKALSKQVNLLILDEPTAALNDSDSEQLLELMRQLQSEGVTCIIISHKLNEIATIADFTTIIRDGETIETLDMHDPEISEGRIIQGMVGRTLNNRYPSREPNIGEELLRVENWTVGHPQIADKLSSDHISLNLHKGEIVGIAGLMGAGRTELVMSIFGHEYGTYKSGKLFCKGKEVNSSTVRRAIKAGIAYVSEDRKALGLNLIGSIKQNISAAALDKLCNRGIINQAQEWKIANQYRESLSIKTPSVEAEVSSLSGGNQQKVSLAKWLFTNPDALILDEPTRGIDVGAKYEIYTLINDLAAKGMGVIVISSEMPELIGICDRIYTINEGRVTGEISRDKFSQEALMKMMTADKEGAQ